MVGPHQILTLGWTQGWKIFGVHASLRSPGAFLLFPMEMKSPKFESSVLRGSQARLLEQKAAEQWGWWRVWFPGRALPCQQPGQRGAFSESQPRYLCGFTPGSLPRRRLRCFLWHTSTLLTAQTQLSTLGARRSSKAWGNSNEGFLLGVKAWVEEKGMLRLQVG